jgi:hypothetical protein
MRYTFSYSHSTSIALECTLFKPPDQLILKDCNLPFGNTLVPWQPTASIFITMLAATRGLTVIDVRDSSDFLNKGRLPWSYNIPLKELSDRSFELPPKHIGFFVVTDIALLGETKEWFTARRLGSFCLEGIFVFQNIKSLPVVFGTLKENVLSAIPYEPAPLLSEEIEHLKSVILPDSLIIDVGSGKGRDGIFLGHHFPLNNIICFDNLPGQIETTARFAERNGLKNVFPILANFKATGDLVHHVEVAMAELGFPSNATVSFILFSRFLKRELFDDAAELLQRHRNDGNTKGTIGVHSFLMSNVKPKKVKDKVHPGELATVFREKYGMSVVRDNTHNSLTDGRELSMFLAST